MPDQSVSRHLAHLPAMAAQPIVFLTATAHDRRRILDNPVAHNTLREIWTASAERNGWFVGDYVVMPDHVHLFARATINAIRLQEWIKLWKSISARRMSAQGVATAPVWQVDYFDRYLRSAESYGDKWSYVSANPVRAGLVKVPEEWPYRGQIHSLSM